MIYTKHNPLDDSYQITGAEWRLFYTHLWPKDWYHDDYPEDMFDENGNLTLKDEKLYTLSNLGYFGYQGTDKNVDNKLKPIKYLYKSIMLPHLNFSKLLTH